MSKASLRNDRGNPFLYLEDSIGSTAFGVDDTTNRVNLITSNAAINLEPSSGGAVFSVDQTANGNIEFAPHGTGDSQFLNGDVGIVAGNLNMPDTAVGGTQGVINLGPTRFIHNRGANNTFIGDLAGNFGLSGSNNACVGTTALLNVTSGSNNTCVGVSAGSAITSSGINTAIGAAALSSLTTGTGTNVAIGSSALGSLVSGIQNTALGYTAGNSYTGTESSNIIIGNVGTVADGNAIRIGTQGALPGQQNKCFIAGINGTVVTPAGNVVINSSGQLGTIAGTPTTWTVVTGLTQAAAVNSGYIANNAGVVTITLPTTAAVGTILEITGMNNATGWKIAQSAGQQVFFGTTQTTLGAAGFLQSTATRDSIRMVCIIANLTWNELSSSGNITVT